MSKIVVIGSANIDLVAVTRILPRAGETIHGESFFSEPGGKGANQAFAAAKLGGDVAMLGRIGDDEYGSRIRASLESIGCDISGLRVGSGRTGVAVILVTESGQNSIVVIPGANESFRPSDLEADAARLADARFALLQLEIPTETVISAAKAARRFQAQVILDPAPARPDLPIELLSRVDILTPNENEAMQLLGHDPAPLSAAAAVDIARQLQHRGVRTVVIKLGPRGCLLADGEDMALIPAPEVRVTDTTGAGDVFNAALAVACSEGASLLDGCKAAVLAASLSVTRFGAQHGAPDRSELNWSAGV